MTQAHITLRDIARRVGVHTSTVSRVLNPATRYKVSSAVAERVTDAARTLGYRPNPLAYGLRTNRSMTVGVVVPDLTNPIFPPIIRGIEDTLVDAGYTAILANSDNDITRERSIVETMRARHIDGLILATADRHAPVVEGCLEDGVPLVLIHRAADLPGVSTVTADDNLGMELLIRHLFSLGHRRIGHIAGPLNYSTGKNRYEGFQRALRAHGIEPALELIEQCETYSDVEGKHATEILLDRNPSPTAIVAANDIIAIGCYDALRERGIDCPTEISITGYNDIRFADKLSPGLTTVRIPQFQAGAHAAAILLERLRDEAAPARSQLMLPTLVVRGSTAAPAQ
ncbi:MAG: LacI family DNA-binding transcriptional regulator [Alphaproteobacteria bacterium]